MNTLEKKRVLIALDYDPTAQKVAEMGYELGKKMDAEVILLHVITTPVYYTETYLGFVNIAPYQDEDIESLLRYSHQYLEETKRHLGDTEIITVIKEGEFAWTILEAAEEFLADVIVLGSHSRRWLEDVLMGSVTEKVLHHTTIPLYIVPTKKTN